MEVVLLVELIALVGALQHQRLGTNSSFLLGLSWSSLGDMGGDDGLIISARFYAVRKRCLIASWHLGKSIRRSLLAAVGLDFFRIPSNGIFRVEGLSCRQGSYEFPF